MSDRPTKTTRSTQEQEEGKEGGKGKGEDEGNAGPSQAEPTETGCVSATTYIDSTHLTTLTLVDRNV